MVEVVYIVVVFVAVVVVVVVQVWTSTPRAGFPTASLIGERLSTPDPERSQCRVPGPTPSTVAHPCTVVVVVVIRLVMVEVVYIVVVFVAVVVVVVVQVWTSTPRAGFPTASLIGERLSTPDPERSQCRVPGPTPSTVAQTCTVVVVVAV